MRLSFGHQTVLVRGDHAAALMDLARNEVQRITLAVADLLERTVDLQHSADLTVEEAAVIEFLFERNLIRSTASDRSLRFRMDSRLPMFPRLRALSLEYPCSYDVDLLVRQVKAWNARLGLASLSIFVTKESVNELSLLATVSDLLRLSAGLVVWVVAPRSVAETIRGSALAEDSRVQIYIAAVEDIPGATRFEIPAVTQSAFISRAEFYHLIENYGESFGCLHVDKYGHFYPDPMENHIRTGSLSECGGDQIEKILDRSELYWRSNKSERMKCRGCEYRLCCPNSVAARSDLEDLTSPPSNCSYDLVRGVWM